MCQSSLLSASYLPRVSALKGSMPLWHVTHSNAEHTALPSCDSSLLVSRTCFRIMGDDEVLYEMNLHLNPQGKALDEPPQPQQQRAAEHSTPVLPAVDVKPTISPAAMLDARSAQAGIQPLITVTMFCFSQFVAFLFHPFKECVMVF